MNDFERARSRMVAEQIHARGVRDAAVLQAMSKVPRENIVAFMVETLSAAQHIAEATFG